MKRITILHVEDELNVSDGLEKALLEEASRLGLNINYLWRKTAADGIATVKKNAPDVVIADHFVPHGMEYGEDDFPTQETIPTGLTVLLAAKRTALRVWYTGDKFGAERRFHADLAFSGTDEPYVVARDVLSRAIRMRR